MTLSLPQFLISILLFAVLFFGVGFIVNMLLKTTWLVPLLYPVIVILMIDRVSTLKYFIEPHKTFTEVLNRLASLAPTDLVVLSAGLIGTIAAAVTIKILRSKGYRMF